jgi:hypothetical protein
MNFMDERPQQTYICYNKGCPNGYMSEFQDAPEEWWASKERNTPRNCQACRAWKKREEAIGDTVVRCTTCGQPIRTPYKYRISFYKNEGPYVQRTICRSCERGVKVPKGRVDEQREEAGLTNKEVSIARLKITQQNVSILLNTNLAAPLYQDQRVRNKLGVLQSREEHLREHLPGTLGQSKDGRVNSPTTLAWQDPSTTALMRSARIIAGVTSSDRQRLYTNNSNGNFIKVTLTDSHHVEVTVISKNAGPEGHELITTYDNYTVEQVKSKLDSGAWH